MRANVLPVTTGLPVLISVRGDVEAILVGIGPAADDVERRPKCGTMSSGLRADGGRRRLCAFAGEVRLDLVRLVRLRLDHWWQNMMRA
jgi:hypothetical protein